MSAPLPPGLSEAEQIHWAALQTGTVLFLHCRTCDNRWFPPTGACVRCLGDAIEWIQAGGEAVLVSWVVYHRAFGDVGHLTVPYAVCLVELAEGPRMIASLAEGVTSSELECGMPGGLTTRALDGLHRLAFTPDR